MPALTPEWDPAEADPLRKVLVYRPTPALAWVDIETTGLDPLNDLILEVGVLITDENLAEIAATSLVVGYPGFDARSMAIDYVKEMHDKSGLWEDVAASETPLGPVSKALAYWLDYARGAGLPMAGSSIHFDRQFLAHRMPEFEALFHYRNIDVSTVKELCRLWRPDLFAGRPFAGREAPAKPHRVLDDLRDSVAELSYYRNTFLNGRIL
jgi:oligoribonuclease